MPLEGKRLGGVAYTLHNKGKLDNNGALGGAALPCGQMKSNGNSLKVTSLARWLTLSLGLRVWPKMRVFPFPFFGEGVLLFFC